MKKLKMSSASWLRESHILIKHQGSQRKASWKDPEGRVISNTTKECAVSQLKAIRDDIVSGKAKFDEVTFRLSDYNSTNAALYNLGASILVGLGFLQLAWRFWDMLVSRNLAWGILK